MLVLSRHIDERIIIDTGVGIIEIMVVDIRGDKVRLGFDAPQHIVIHREEVYDAIASGISRYRVAAVVQRQTDQSATLTA